MCAPETGGSLPAGYLAAVSPPARPAATVTSTVTQLPAGSCENWNRTNDVDALDSQEAQCQPRNARLCCPLSITNLKLGVPATAVIAGVRVRVWRRATEAGSRGIADGTARLIVGGAQSGEDKADTATKWPIAVTEKVYGGPTDLWGQSLTAAQVNATGFGFALSTNFVGNDGAEGRVDYVQIEVFLAGDADCNDADNAVWVTRDLYVDADHDNYTVGAATPTCLGATVPTGSSAGSLGTDCYDANAAAHPGQTAYYTVQRGDGLFDYNCNGATERAAIGYDTGCMCDATPSCVSSGASSFTPTTACGASNSIDACAGECTTPTCGLVGTSSVTRCH